MTLSLANATQGQSHRWLCMYEMCKRGAGTSQGEGGKMRDRDQREATLRCRCSFWSCLFGREAPFLPYNIPGTLLYTYLVHCYSRRDCHFRGLVIARKSPPEISLSHLLLYALQELHQVRTQNAVLNLPTSPSASLLMSLLVFRLFACLALLFRAFPGFSYSCRGRVFAPPFLFVCLFVPLWMYHTCRRRGY